MADKKITELPNINGTDLVDADEFVVVDISADETKAITLAELKTAFDAGTGFVRVTGDAMTGVLKMPDGSNSAPSISNTGDTNTGMFFGAADTVSFTAGGTKRLDINTSGIGVTGNITATNQITASGLTGILGASNSQAATVTTLETGSQVNLNFVIDSTSSTSGAVIIDGGVGIAKKLFVGTDLAVDGTTNLDVVNIDGAVGMAGTFTLNGAAGISGQLTVAGGADSAPSYSFTGDPDTGISRPTTNTVNIVTDGSERMRIDSSGHVMIGTATEGSVDTDELTLSGSGRVGMTIRSTNSNSSRIYFSDGTSGDSEYVGYLVYDHSSNHMRFGTNAVERMRIDSGGNVGIGGTSTGYKVHLFGNESMIRMQNTGSGTNGFLDLAVSSTVATINANYSSSAIPLRFLTGAAERMRLESNGDLLVLGGTVRIKDSGNSAQRGAIYGDASSFHINAGVNNLIAYSAGTERMRIDNNGNLLIGTTSTSDFDDSGFRFRAGATGHAEFVRTSTNDGSANIYVVRGDDGRALSFYRNDGTNRQVGNIFLNTSSTVYTTSSDHRLKENVDYDWDATTRLKQLKPARFNFIIDADTTVDGFLAHEAQAVVPECVTGTHNEVDDDGNAVMQGIDQSQLVPLLVKTIQELEARITILEA